MNMITLGEIQALLLLFLTVCFPAVLAGEELASVRMRSLEVLQKDSQGGEIRYPSALFHDPVLGESYAVVGGENRLVIYGADYFPQLDVGAGRGINPVSCVFVGNGLLYACVGTGPAEPAHIAVLSPSLLPVKKIYFSGFVGADSFTPKDVLAVGDFLYVADGKGPAVVLDAKGKYLRSIEPRTDLLGVQEKAPILALERDGKGKIYLLSEAASKVFVYDADERFLFSFGEKGGVLGKLSRPRGISIDERNQRIYLVDYMRHSVSAYDLEGRFQFEFGGKGVGRGWFQYPSDVAVDGKGNVLVADTFNHRIQVFTAESGQGP